MYEMIFNKIYKKNKPDLIINAAAKVGGILSNQKFKADIIYQNTIIQINLIIFKREE